MTEFAPKGSSPRMTQAQIRKYLANMGKAQAEALKKLDPEKEKAEKAADLSRLEQQLDDII